MSVEDASEEIAWEELWNDVDRDRDNSKTIVSAHVRYAKHRKKIDALAYNLGISHSIRWMINHGYIDSQYEQDTYTSIRAAQSRRLVDG